MAVFWSNLLTAVLMLLVLAAVDARPGNLHKSSFNKDHKESGNKLLCEPDHLTVYRVILNTFWNEQNFPKHYPQWRPPAQWSKLVGRSHDKSYILFRLGRKSSAGLKIFAENGRSDTLDAQSQGEGGVYDEFNAPPITSGQGRSEAEFFVDGNHSRVSLISKMVPSPDWFIGIDSFDLCVNGKWLDAITIEVDTIDAGTDNGFTFTSPNWPTEPQGVIHRLTSNYPNHPASSFFYSGLKKLPIIASFQFIKVKEYELSEVFHHSEDASANEVLKMEHISYVYEEGEGNTFILKKNASSSALSSSSVSTTTNAVTSDRVGVSVGVVAVPVQPQQPKKVDKIDEQKTVNQIPSVVEELPTPSSIKQEKHHHQNAPKLTRPDIGNSNNNNNERDAATVKNIIDIYSIKKHHKSNADSAVAATGAKDHHQRASHSHHKKAHHNNKKDVRKIRPPRDCEVGEWSEWTACSKSCDIGESTRGRTVVHHARRGGQPCPPLFEKKWCGSARSCNRRYFNWSK